MTDRNELTELLRSAVLAQSGPYFDQGPYVSQSTTADYQLIKGHINLETVADAIIAAGWRFDGSCRDCQATNGHHPWCPTHGDTQHRHHYVDVATFADADAGLHRWLCECGGATLSRDRA